MTTHQSVSDPTRLAPEDALTSRSVPFPPGDADSTTTNSPGAHRNVSARRTRDQRRNESRNRRRKGQWKKLLWVRQSCRLPLSLHGEKYDGGIMADYANEQTRIITRTRRHSLMLFSETHGYDPTSSGLSSRTRRSSFSKSAP